VHRKSTLRE